jgi:hypothetical protein
LVVLCVFGGEYIYQYHVKKERGGIREQLIMKPTLKPSNNLKPINGSAAKLSQRLPGTN